MVKTERSPSPSPDTLGPVFLEAQCWDLEDTDISLDLASFSSEETPFSSTPESTPPLTPSSSTASPWVDNDSELAVSEHALSPVDSEMPISEEDETQWADWRRYVRLSLSPPPFDSPITGKRKRSPTPPPLLQEVPPMIPSPAPVIPIPLPMPMPLIIPVPLIMPIPVHLPIPLPLPVPVPVPVHVPAVQAPIEVATEDSEEGTAPRKRAKTSKSNASVSQPLAHGSRRRGRKRKSSSEEERNSADVPLASTSALISGISGSHQPTSVPNFNNLAIPADIVDGTRKSVTQEELNAYVDACKLATPDYEKNEYANQRRVEPATHACIICRVVKQENHNFTTRDRMKYHLVNPHGLSVTNDGRELLDCKLCPDTRAKEGYFTALCEWELRRHQKGKWHKVREEEHQRLLKERARAEAEALELRLTANQLGG